MAGLASGHWGYDWGPSSAAQDRSTIGAGEKLVKRKKGAAAKTVPFFIDDFPRSLSKNFRRI